MDKKLPLAAVRRYARDGMSVYAAAVSFWAFISIVPLLAMVVFGVGLLAEPESINRFLDEMSSTIPGDTMEMLTSQARTWTAVSTSTSSLGLVIAVAGASWGASSGVSHMIRAINAAHGRERRAFADRRITALVRTVMALVFVIPIVMLIAATPSALEAADADPLIGWTITIVRWPIAILLFVVLLSATYWIAPTTRSKFRLITPGVVVAGLVFVAGSAAFSIYAGNVDKYDQSYGSLATIIVTMLWTYVSTSAILLGAEVDAVAERMAPASEPQQSDS